MIILHGIMRSYASYCTEVQAFLTANTGISGSTEKNALDTAIRACKTANIYSKFRICYPTLGGDSTTHSYNIVDPSLHQITWYNAAVHNAYGVLGDGISAYGNTGFNIDPGIPNIYSNHYVAYNTLSTGYGGDADGGSMLGYGIGQNAGSNGGTNLGFLLNGVYRSLNDNLYPARMDNTLTAPNEWKGFIGNSRLTSSFAFCHRQGATISTTNTSVSGLSYGMTTNGRTNLWQRPLFILGMNNPSNVQWDANQKAVLDSRYCGKQRLGWISAGDGLTEAEMITYQGIIQTYQTSLGRNV